MLQTGPESAEVAADEVHRTEPMESKEIEAGPGHAGLQDLMVVHGAVWPACLGLTGWRPLWPSGPHGAAWHGRAAISYYSSFCRSSLDCIFNCMRSSNQNNIIRVALPRDRV